MSRPFTLPRDDGRALGWHLTIISRGVVLLTVSSGSRQEIEALAAEARRLRPDVKIFIRPPDGAATLRSDPRQLELDLEPLLIPSRPSR